MPSPGAQSLHSHGLLFPFHGAILPPGLAPSHIWRLHSLSPWDYTPPNGLQSPPSPGVHTTPFPECYTPLSLSLPSALTDHPLHLFPFFTSLGAHTPHPHPIPWALPWAWGKLCVQVLGPILLNVWWDSYNFLKILKFKIMGITFVDKIMEKDSKTQT